MARKYRSRRQQIIAEQRVGLIRLGVIGALILIILIVGISSCTSCGEKPRKIDKEDKISSSNVRDKIPDSVEEYPRLINAEKRLDAGYTPVNLTYLLGIPNGTEIRLCQDAAVAFSRMHSAMVADGMAIIPLSGFRSYEEQVLLYNYNVFQYMSQGMTQEEATEVTLRFIAPPGASEHQYGRSIDVTTDGTTQHDFQETEQGIWIKNHAHEYGFIIRYPSDKEDITGIGYEPWHLRYVGVDHAKYMTEHNLCLEEYIKYIKIDCPWATEERL